MEPESPNKDRWLTEDEEKRLLLACPAWLQDVVVFALDTGCRRREILSLTWRQIDLDRTFLAVQGAKTSAWRGIPFTDRVGELLLRLRTGADVDDPVFTRPGRALIGIGELRWAFECACRRAGMRHFRFHDLRHSFATRLARSGVDLYVIQRLLAIRRLR